MTTPAERLVALAGTGGTPAALLLAISGLSSGTPAQLLVNYSGLSSGTPAEHLLTDKAVGSWLITARRRGRR